MTNKQRWVLVLTAVASLMVALDVTVVSTALSTMRLHLHASIAQLEWTVNAYGLTFAVLLMTGSVLGDRLGRRRLFVGGLALFSAASAACALSPDVGWLIAARAVQGAGAAVIAPVSLALLSEAFPPERRGSALGIYGAITGLAVVAGPVVGGAVTQGLAWQWIFWLNVPIGLAAIPFVLARIDEGFGPRTAPDVPGLALFTGAALGIVWGLVRGNAVGWSSLEVVVALAGGVLFALLFVIRELRASEPMLPTGLFRSRGFAAGNVVSLLMFAALFSAVFFMAQYLQIVLGQSPLATGLRLIPWTGTVFLVSPLAGALVDRIGERPLIVSGLVMQAVGFAWVALIARTGLSYSHMIAPLILAGVGISTALPAVQNATISGVPPTEIGKAAGTFSTMRQLGGALGLAIAVAVFTGAGSYASPEAFSNGFGPAIAVSAALSLCGGLTGLALRARSRGSAAAVPALEAAGGS
jgi:EmrB/QacA subfamily drug resistance transporter